MRLEKKLTLGAILLGVIPVLLATSLTGWISNQKAKVALEEQAQSRLVAVRDGVKEGVEDYFQLINNQVKTLSASSMVINAMRGFKRAYNDYANEVSSRLPPLSAQRAELGTYYSEDFAREYQGRNGGKSINMAATVAGLDKESVLLQHRFIKANTNPLGSKDAMADPGDGSVYGMLHQAYHPILRDYLNTFEYYDIFLADPDSGDIIYSVFKELDFTTSLIDGPYASSAIGKVFRAANQATDPNMVAVTDFAPYTPSYEDQAGFVASPIFDEGEKIGVLIFQMPIGRINAMMTHDGAWEEAGLGVSGETYLVGADGRTRSDSRFLIEDKPAYLAALKAAGVSVSTLDMIESKGSNIGLQPVDTKGAKAAISGQTGFDIFPDHRNVPVLSAYAPLEIQGIDWVIMSEIDEAEAFAAVTALTKDITTTTVGSVLVVLVLATLLGKWLARSIVRPLSASVEVMKDIAEGEGDLTQRLDDKGGDELADFAGAYNQFADKLSGVIGQAQAAAEQVSSGVNEVRDGSVDLSQRTEEQAASLEETAASMEQMTANVRQSADNTAQADELARRTREQAEHGGQVVANAVSAMAEVNEASKKIADIIGMVGEIAFQTNLLALNASVEAARAGEQGRGFAVVATEVRNLAQRSATAATDIKTLIGNTVEKVDASAKLIEQSGESLGEIIEGISQVSDLVGAIHTASQEQAMGIDQVNDAIGQMDETTQQNAALVEESSATADTMAGEAQTLARLMDTFKVSNDESREAA